MLLSVALHALALFVAPSLRDSYRRVEAWPGPIAARLVQPPSAVEPAVQPVPSPKPPPVAKAATRSPSRPMSPAPVAETPSAPGSPAAPAAPAAEAPAAPAARPGADTDADSIGRFRMQVIDAARAFNVYPRTARENSWEGRVDVRISFNREGRRTAIVVVRSSGYEILDRQAIETFTQAFVPVPPALRGKEFAFEIPMVFNLKDGR
jgi:protein TonB